MTAAGTAFRDKLRWYAGAATGPVASAGAQFLFSLILLARLPVADFGRLAFLLVVAQLGIGLWTALFTSPMLVLVARREEREAGEQLAGLTAASRLALVPAAIVFAGIALAMGLGPAGAALFAGYGAMVLLRQFARSHAIAHGRYGRSVMSDLVYSAALVAGGALLLAVRAEALLALALLTAAILAGLLAFLFGGAIGAQRGGALRPYGAVWRRDARWSVIGVVTTEATVNSHSYIVAALLGPAAFAPVAATALAIRPVTVAINALVEFERARTARWLAQGDLPAVRSARRHLRGVLAAVWVLMLGSVALALAALPAGIVAARFDRPTVVLGVSLWFAVALARLLHAPEGVVLLAAGRFRTLAAVSGWTALVSLAAVTALAMWAGPIWSIAGVALGEACFAVALRRLASRQLR